MENILQKICRNLQLDQSNLNEIEIDDVELTTAAQQNIKDVILQMLSLKNQEQNIPQLSIASSNGLPCKSFWVENTKELILYVWIGEQSNAIIVPKDFWTIRDDIIYN